MKRTLHVVAGALVLASAVLGCGGKSSSGTLIRY